jgi:hypothetical protein
MRHDDRDRQQRGEPTGGQQRAPATGARVAPRSGYEGHSYETAAALARPDAGRGVPSATAGPGGDALGAAAADLSARHGDALSAAAARAGVPAPALAAVVLTEAAGLGEVEPGALPIRFEPYVFWQRTGSWVVATHRDQTAEQNALAAARSIDEGAALASLRMGLGQLSGAEASAAGYADAAAMYAAFSTDSAAQIAALGEVVAADATLQGALGSEDWCHVAALRAGPAYHAIGYDDGLAAAAAAYAEQVAHGGDDDGEDARPRRRRGGRR